MAATANHEQRLRRFAEQSFGVGPEASLEAVLQRTLETAARLVAARYAALGVLDRTGSHVAHLLTTGIDEETRAGISHLPGDHGGLRALLRQGRPVRLADVTSGPQFEGFPAGHPPMRSLLGVPISVRDVRYGDMYLAGKDGGRFTDEDERLAMLLAAQAAITIETARLSEGLARRTRQLEVLNELTVAVLAERDVPRLLNLVARRMRGLTRARRVLVSIPTPSGSLRVAAADGEGGADLVGHIMPAESKAAGVLRRARSERIDAILDDPEVDRASARRAGSLSALVIPLVVHRKAVAVVSALNKDAPDPRFTGDDLRLAEAFATRAALAVHVSQRMARETVEAMLEAQEVERIRIARELHDEAGSALTAVLLGLAGIDEAATLEEAHHAAAALRRAARSTLENVGRVALGLRPPALDEFGVGPAIRELGSALEARGGPTVKVDEDVSGGGRLPARVETALFRITQEALTNVVKHADAHSVRIRLARRERSVLLRVEDDGRGFARAQIRGDGLGLAGMRDRITSLEGVFDIESAPGVGTRLTVEIPLVEPATVVSGGGQLLSEMKPPTSAP